MPRATHSTDELASTRVAIVGAGISGLMAARALEARGAEVVLFEARSGVGGRIRTLRAGFEKRQYAEAGADLIDGDQETIRNVIEELGLPLVRILRSGFAQYRDGWRKPRWSRSAAEGWAGLQRSLAELIRSYAVAESRWDGPIARDIAVRSVAAWLDEIGAGPDLRDTADALRGFFLADPDELSLLALVDQLASAGSPSGHRFYRIRGGNDRLPQALASRLRGPVHPGHAVRRIAQGPRGTDLAIETDAGRLARIRADYAIVTVPATMVREIAFDPALPAVQHEAMKRLRYGRATKANVQFARAFWRRTGHPRACGTNLPIGAVWDASEDQGGRPAVLTLLTGGRSADALQAIVDRGAAEIARRLRWFGAGATEVLSAQRTLWHDEAWSRGGYAVFDPSFDPELRSWLGRAHGRVLFAGEHTSFRWQGYMNGAAESGLRAAAEVAALVRSSRRG